MEFDGAAAAMHIDVSADVWQIDFTARLAGMDEARRLLAFDHYGEAAFLGDGFQVSYQDGTATVAAGVGYVGGLRVSLREPYSLPAAVGDTLWIDASWQGFVTGEWNTVLRSAPARNMRLIQTVTASDTLSRHLQNDRRRPTGPAPGDTRRRTKQCTGRARKIPPSSGRNTAGERLCAVQQLHRQRRRRPRRHIKGSKSRNG